MAADGHWEYFIECVEDHVRTSCKRKSQDFKALWGQLGADARTKPSCCIVPRPLPPPPPPPLKPALFKVFCLFYDSSSEKLMPGKLPKVPSKSVMAYVQPHPQHQRCHCACKSHCSRRSSTARTTPSASRANARSSTFSCNASSPRARLQTFLTFESSWGCRANRSKL